MENFVRLLLSLCPRPTRTLREASYKWRHYEAQIILRCVRWYLSYPLSYRQVTEMVNERGLDVHHTTVFRWVQEYGTEIDKRYRPYLRPTNDSWRVDETYIKVKGKPNICIELLIQLETLWASY